MNEREVIKGVIKIPNPNFNPELEVDLENPRFIALPTIKGDKGDKGEPLEAGMIRQHGGEIVTITKNMIAGLEPETE